MKTITYFEIFTFLLFFGVFLLRTLLMHFRGIKVFVIAKGKKLREKLLEMLFMPTFFGWAILLGILLFNSGENDLPNWIAGNQFESVFLDLVGTALLALTLILFIGALISFGDSWRVGIDDKEPGSLIDTGIFALSRNPIFLSIDLYFLGTALLHSSWLFLALALITPIGIHIQIRNEEKFLINHYGNNYENYALKTPRYLLFK